MNKNAMRTASGFLLGAQVPYVDGRDIVRVRRWLGATQEQLAAHLGRDVRTIQRWESEPRKMINNPSICRDIDFLLRLKKEVAPGVWRCAND